MNTKRGMDAARLSARERQPGHDRTFVTSESNFVTAAAEILDPTRYLVEDKPQDLRYIFADELGALGVMPDAGITNRKTGRKLFVEIKKQGPAGNAEERAFKHHTLRFAQLLHEIYGYDYHPFVTVWCENLATDRRYTLKARYLFEPNNYLLWVDYDVEVLRTYLLERCREWLDS